MKLAADCNPNIVELLWTDESDIVFSHPAYDLLRDHAHQLLSKKIAFTTSGYALAQLKRIKGHNKWINNPQSENPPQQVDYVSLVHNFTPEKMFKINLRQYKRNHRLVPFCGDTFGLYQLDGYSPFNEKTGALNTEYEGDSDKLGTLLVIVKYNRSVYEAAKEQWSNYWTWKKNRNAKRSELKEKFGFNTKHAMHLVRLLRMGEEALRDGVILVKQPDAQELLSIRASAWTYEEIVEYAEEKDATIKNMVVISFLPAKPNIKLATELIMQAQDLIWIK